MNDFDILKNKKMAKHSWQTKFPSLWTGDRALGERY